MNECICMVNRTLLYKIITRLDIYMYNVYHSTIISFKLTWIWMNLNTNIVKKFWASSYLFPLVYWQVQRNLWPLRQTTQTMSAGKHTEKKNKWRKMKTHVRSLMGEYSSVSPDHIKHYQVENSHASCGTMFN